MQKFGRLLILVLGAVAFAEGVVVVYGPPTYEPPQFRLTRDKAPRMLPIIRWEDDLQTSWQKEITLSASMKNGLNPVTPIALGLGPSKLSEATTARTTSGRIFFCIIRHMNKARMLEEIEFNVVNLRSSPFYEDRLNNNYIPVIGEGSLDASIMFIGEAPGKNEALTGKPFCGASGRILDELLKSIKLPREGVYITNIMKDRPPQNRDPLPSEIEIYSPFLDRQIEIIKPKVIATLGRFSMKYIMDKFGLSNQLEPISQIHGSIFKVNTDLGELNIIPLYHPAVVVYNSKSKDELKADFKKLKKFI